MKVETTAIDESGLGLTVTAYSVDYRTEVVFLDVVDGEKRRVKLSIAAVDFMRFAAAARELVRLEAKA